MGPRAFPITFQWTVRNYLKSPLPLRGRVRVGVKSLPRAPSKVQFACFEIVSKPWRLRNRSGYYARCSCGSVSRSLGLIRWRAMLSLAQS